MTGLLGRHETHRRPGLFLMSANIYYLSFNHEMDQSRMMSKYKIGFPQEWGAFFERHPLWPDKYLALNYALEIYFPGFFYPTLHTHATPSSLMSRLKSKDDGTISFNEGAQREWADRTLIVAHNLIVSVLKIQNDYFDLKFDSIIEDVAKDFEAIWGNSGVRPDY